MSFNIGKILRAAKKIKVEPPREEIKVPKKPETARRVSSFREKTFENKKTSAGRKLRRKKITFFYPRRQEWNRLLKDAAEPGFRKKYPATSILIDNVKKSLKELKAGKNKIDKKKKKYIKDSLEKEVNNALEIYELEKKWLGCEILKEKFNNTQWQNLFALYGEKSFEKKFPATSNFFKIADKSVSKLKVFLLELYKKETLFKEGNISKEEFKIIWLKIRLAIARKSLQNASAVIEKLEKFKPKPVEPTVYFLREVKKGKLSSEYPYTAYFLKDKNINAITAEELEKVKSLLALEQEMSLVNMAYAEVGRSHTIAEELAYAGREKKCEAIADIRARRIINYKKIEKHFDFLQDLSGKIYKKLLGIIMPENKGVKFQNLLCGFFPSPGLLIKNINVLNNLPPALLEFLAKNGQKIFFNYRNKEICRESRKVNSGRAYEESGIAEVDNADSGTALHETGHLVEFLLEGNKFFESIWNKYKSIRDSRKEVTNIIYMLDLAKNEGYDKKMYRADLYESLRQEYKNYKIKLIKCEVVTKKSGRVCYFDYVEIKINGKIFKGCVLPVRATAGWIPRVFVKRETFAEAFYFYYAEKEKLRRYDPELFQFMEKFDRRWRWPAR